MLAAAGGVDLDGLDDALSQRSRGERAALQGIINPFDLKLHVLDVHGVGNAVRENKNAIPWAQLDLATRIVKSIDHTQRQADDVLGRGFL